MKSFTPIMVSLLLAACSQNTTNVRISDGGGKPIRGFPLHFELDQGLEQTNIFGMSENRPLNPGGVLLEGELTRINDSTFGTLTNSMGYASISYDFKEGQQTAQNVTVIPLYALPKRSRISVTVPTR